MLRIRSQTRDFARGIFGGVTFLALASFSIHAAIVSVPAMRGSVTDDSSSLGAFSLVTDDLGPNFKFVNWVWLGNLNIQHMIPDSLCPGYLTETTTITQDSYSTLPIQFGALYPSLPYILRPSVANSTAASTPRINEPPGVVYLGEGLSYSFKFTPLSDGLSVKFSGGFTTNPLPGGGTVAYTVSGTFSRSSTEATGGTWSTSWALRLASLDTGKYIAPTILVTTKETGTWQYSGNPPPAP